ncbi:MAG: serine hydrolase domain-containing protein [Pseudomonadota bacterium]
MTPSLHTTLLAPLIYLALLPSSAAADAIQISVQTRPDLEAIVQQSYPDDAPGAAVIVVHEGKTLYRGAHGLANLELSVPLRAEHVFRIGSITKQMTAAAILLLAEQGRLDLSDPITKYLPDYHTQGHRVTIQHLLSHTSGIANYTELRDWQSITRSDVSADQLIRIFQDKPFDFTPGERWKYDNSGYVLLGAIIEKVSGQPYADFLRTRIFGPLGMQNSSYDNTARITPGRVAGYMRDGATWRNADFVSMSQPYAAGGLTSTVDDLAIWNAAIESGGLLKPSSWQRASTSFALSDGTPTRYGAGWIVGRVGPVATLEHGGGINGFNSYVLRVPAAHLYVAVLANASPPLTPPQDVAVKLAARALAISMDTPEIAIAEDRLNDLAGRYLLEGAKVLTVSRERNRLYAAGADADRLELVPIGTDLFEERTRHTRFRFQREGGRVTALEVEPRILMGERARRADVVR